MVDDYQAEALEQGLSHAKVVYDDLAATWRDIERKAQGNTAIAGVFLAGASLVYRFTENPPDYLGVGLFVCVLLLAVSALLSILVLLVSEMESIEDLEKLYRSAQGSVSKGGSDEAKESYNKFIGERLEAWKNTNESLHKENCKKAGWLMWAQIVLVVAIVGVVIMMSMVLLP